jgi:thymidylate synthase
MEWFMSGSNKIEDLHDKVKPWWKSWADSRGTIKNNYSKQFRDFHGRVSKIDQIQYLIESIKKDPFSRRHVITSWNTADMAHQSTLLTNCHGSLIQAFVSQDGWLDLTMYQRSADMILGVPHNLIQYWAFLLYLANKTGYTPRSFNWIGGDCHIYKSHYEATREILATYTNQIETPVLTYNASSDTFKADDFMLLGEYEPIIKKSLELIV